MKKKLIEVALPLEAINAASAREKSIRHGHPSTMHIWWARRPLAAARAVIFAQMVDDPSSYPDLFPTEKAQEKERQRLFRIIEDLVLWENTTNEEVLDRARAEIWQSWRRACAENADHPRAKELFDRNRLPAFHDPFAGGGALPLEAQRLGLESYASDLNPVAVLINKAMIEIPPKFAGKPPVNPNLRGQKDLLARQWGGAEGLAEDVRYYGQWMRDEAEKRIGHLYPRIYITAEMAKERSDLKPFVGQKLTVIAWLWARTVNSPNPAFAHIDVPLASTFMLSTNAGKEAYIEPVIESGGYRFTVKVGKPKDSEAAKRGTKLARGANFRCLMSGTPIEGDYIKAEGRAGRMGVRLMAIIAESERGRVYLQPTPEHDAAARKAKPEWRPELSLPNDPRNFWTVQYGLTTYSELFTPRQLMGLTTFSDLVKELREPVERDALAAGMTGDSAGGTGASAYSAAVQTYLAFAVSKCADYWNTSTTWMPRGTVGHLFARQAIPMTWDYPEANPLSNFHCAWQEAFEWVSKAIETLPGMAHGIARQEDAAVQSLSADKAISTDPPYYDNISYADLSDFFYVWIRRSLQPIFPELFTTLAVPKAEELIATPYRHGNNEKAEAFFLDGMTLAMHRLAQQAHPAFPVSIYYAFKQAETESEEGASSTGWETFLNAVIRAGFDITGTWPMRTERAARSTGIGTNALASSIILICRSRRQRDSVITTRRQFVTALKSELPKALAHLQRSNIAPVDLAQSAIGPGMAIYTRYARVLDATGQTLSVRNALSLINQTLDEVLAEQEGDFDSDSRWAVTWFGEYGFDEGEYGVAETLSKAKDTSIAGLADAGILISGRGKVRLLRPTELPEEWDPSKDKRLTTWEMVHHLIHMLEAKGESGAAELVTKLGAGAEQARELAYRLYSICDRKKWAQEAMAYNSLVIAWPEIIKLASVGSRPTEQRLFE
jgi:putative DNA methylase